MILITDLNFWINLVKKAFFCDKKIKYSGISWIWFSVCTKLTRKINNFQRELPSKNEVIVKPANKRTCRKFYRYLIFIGKKIVIISNLETYYFTVRTTYLPFFLMSVICCPCIKIYCSSIRIILWLIKVSCIGPRTYRAFLENVTLICFQFFEQKYIF